MDLGRSLRRLSRMSPHEIYTRARQDAGKRRDVLLHRLGANPSPGALPASIARGRFYCDPQDVPRILDILRRRMPEHAEEIVARAGRIAARSFDLLGYRGLDFGRDIDWSLDPVHGKRAPSVPWPAVPYLDFTAVGDHKVTWELSRCQFLVTLAKAYRITGEERFAVALKELWYDWRRKNPYPTGVNWTSTLEVAFRTISWMWADFLLEGTPAGADSFPRDVAGGIAQSGWYIERFLSTYFSPNTHLLGEAAALFLVALRYPGLPHAGRWRETGWRVVREEARRQVHPGGFYFEQSTHYHVYALDFFLHVRMLAARNGMEIPPDLDDTIRRMTAALELLSQAGALPRFGDDDGGRLFDPARNRAEHMRDPLSTGAVLFRDGGFKAAAAGLCEETLWLLGPESAAAFDALACAAPPPRAVELAGSGTYATTPPGPPRAQLFIDAGPQGALSAGHGHADALGIQLAAGGRLWLTDPGTCVYMSGDSSREDFRGTPAHNTMTVDGRHQADPAGPFGWGPLPRSEVVRWRTGARFDFFEGRHSGYERLPGLVTHRRSVLRWGSLWLVRDIAAGSGAHRFEINWHVAPEATLDSAGSAAIARCGEETLVILAEKNDLWRLTLAAGEYSSAYGARHPAPVARWTAEAACPVELAVMIGFGAARAGAVLRRIDTGGSGAVTYEYTGAGERRLFFFAAGERGWKSGEWASDAAVLCFGEDELLLIDGSYVEYAGKRALEAPGRVVHLECRNDGREWRANGAASVSLAPGVLP